MLFRSGALVLVGGLVGATVLSVGAAVVGSDVGAAVVGELVGLPEVGSVVG